MTRLPHTQKRLSTRRVVAVVLCGLALMGPSPGAGGLGLAEDPLAVCSRTLRDAWSDLDTGRLDGVDAGIAALTADRRCQLLGTQAEADYLRGRRALMGGDSRAAARAFDSALDAPRVRAGDRPTRPEILYYAGLAREAQGERDRAASLYLELAREFPADARVALVLNVLDGAAASSAEERLEAALQAVETHNYTAAQRLLERILADAVGRPVEATDPAFIEALRAVLPTATSTTVRATYQLGYLWYYWIRELNPRAIPLLEAVSELGRDHAADAGYFVARAHMRAEDYPAARESWARFAALNRRDERVHEATYYQGWLYLDREELTEALAGFEDYLDRFRGAARYDRAIWYLGWTHFRLGQYAQARESFAQLASRGGFLVGAKGRYWEGRCWQAEGNESEAEAAFEELAERYAFTWYGLLARQRLGRPLVPPRAHRRPTAPRARLLELAERGGAMESLAALVEEGDAHHVARYYEDRHPERRLSERLDQLLVRQAAGDAHDDFRGARGHSGQLLRRPPNESSLLHWVQRFPRPWDRWVVPAATAAGVDPLMIWAHMQIESHYFPRYVSYADAQGLLQLIPGTGQQVAAALGEPYAEGMLMDVQTNLRYGAWYLGRLVYELGGQLPIAMCAYNSGAPPMQRWVDENHELDYDAFVEEIPYDQSREYLKRVVGMYVSYLYLYADDDHLTETLSVLFPEHIEARYLGEINF